MRTWSLRAGDPCTLFLSADHRLSDPDPRDDITWQVESMLGDNAVLGVGTTYGLRARQARIFMSFGLDGVRVSNPQQFFQPPELKYFFPNYLQFIFSPFLGLDAMLEYWQPASQLLACRVTFHNQSKSIRAGNLQVSGKLIPIEGEPIKPAVVQSVNVLVGRTSNLEPVLFLTGGPLPGPGPNPSLDLDFQLEPWETRNFTWVQAALPTQQASFDLARKTAARPWDSEQARIFLVNAADLVEIWTGEPGWDAALAFSQVSALRLLFNGGDHLPYPTLVQSRLPDQGWSPRTSGSDQGSSGAGLTPHAALYLTSLLPGMPGLAEGFVRNFISVQEPSGFIDGQPGQAGQRSRLLAAPLLACMAWESFQRQKDIRFLQECFPALFLFNSLWFSPSHDHDEDGFPEWDHPQQTGFEDNPLFNHWQEDERVAPISFYECPDLAATLLKEVSCLKAMAQTLEKPEHMKVLEDRERVLGKALSMCWDNPSSGYAYRDRDTHAHHRSLDLLSKSGNGSFKVDRKFKQPRRLNLHVEFESSHPGGWVITLKGHSANGSLEENLEKKDFRWSPGTAFAASSQVYLHLVEVIVEGLLPKDQTTLSTLDFSQQDETGWLPLWAHLPDDNQAACLVDHLFNEESFWTPTGLACLNKKTSPSASRPCVDFLWNNFAGEGLLAYGMRSQAARLVTRLMVTAVKSLRLHSAFFNSYQPESGSGLGEMNSLAGLVPVGLFLRTLGVEIISNNQVRLEGMNPFPWNVTIQYRGLSIERSTDRTEVTFPDGEKVLVSNPTACLVSHS